MLNFIKKNPISLTVLVVAVIAVVWVQMSVATATRQLAKVQEMARQETLGLFDKADMKVEKLDGKITDLVQRGYVERDDFGHIASRVAAATVLVTNGKNVQKLSESGSLIVEKTSDPEGSAGTGFFVDSSGLIATAKHVVDGIGKDDLVIKTSTAQIYTAKLVDSDDKADVALLRINKGDYPAVELGYFDNLEAGDEVGFIGFTRNAVAEGSLISRGIVSFKGTDESGAKVFTVNAFVNKGNSGAPVFSTRSGRVLGILSARQRDTTADKFINLPANYQAGVSFGGIDPLKLNIDLYNKTLKIVGDVSQIGIGVVHAADSLRLLMSQAR